MVATLRKEPDQAVTAIEDNNSKVQSGAGMLGTAGETFQTIANQMQGLLDKIQSVTDASAQIAEGSTRKLATRSLTG